MDISLIMSRAWAIARSVADGGKPRDFIGYGLRRAWVEAKRLSSRVHLGNVIEQVEQVMPVQWRGVYMMVIIIGFLAGWGLGGVVIFLGAMVAKLILIPVHLITWAGSALLHLGG